MYSIFFISFMSMSSHVVIFGFFIVSHISVLLFFVCFRTEKNASAPSISCWDRSDTMLLRCHPAWRRPAPTHARQHALDLITEVPSGSPTDLMAFGPPSKAHSLRPSPPRSHQPGALCLVPAGRTYTSSTVLLGTL